MEARLSVPEVVAGHPVELTLTGTFDGSGQELPAPDLSALDQSFQILDRRVERRVSVENGHRREAARLTLLLMPKHGGQVEVPPISFGGERTAPLTLTVKGESDGQLSDQGSERSDWQGPFGQNPWGLDRRWAAGPFGPGPASPSDAWGTQPTADSQSSNPVDTARGLPPVPSPRLRYDQLQPGESAGDRKAAGSSTAGPSMSAAEPSAEPPPPAPRAILSDPWFWVSAVLAATLAGILARRRTPQPAARVEPRAEPAPPPDPIELARDGVRSAYGRGDGAAARDALLAWARLRWPADPPNNLARLAQRCQPPLRGYITDLERAFFSPKPIRWEDQPVADLLGSLPAAPHPAGTAPV